METSERLSGIGEYYFSAKLREIDELNKNGKNIINLGIGSPDMPPHPNVIKKLSEASMLHHVHGYQSYMGSPLLRKAFADWYKKWYNVELNADNEILPLIGSKEGIMHICMAFLNTGDRVLVPNPGYPTYRSAVKLAGAECLEYGLTEENNYFPDWDILEKMALDNVKLMFVNYPQMPTGKRPSEKLFQEIVAFGKKHHILIVHDNPYSFILNDTPISMLVVEGAKDIVVELNSLSKSHNMAGWRIGMLAGSRDNINSILRFKSNMDSGMYLPLQLAAVEALQLDRSWVDEVNAVYKKRRVVARELLDLIGCKYNMDQSGLFVWAKIADDFKDGYDLSDNVLYNSNVFITPGGIFGSNGNNYVRVSLCCTEEKFRESIDRIKRSRA